MDFADLQLQHQLREQFNGYSSSGTKLGYKVPRTQEWNSSIFLINGGSYNTYITESMSRSKELWSSPVSTTICQDSFVHQSANQFLADNKEVMADFFPKHSEKIFRASNIGDQESLLPCSKYPEGSHDLGDSPWLNNFHSGHDITELQLSAGEGCPTPQNPSNLASAAISSRFFSQIFPYTITSALPRSLNLQGLDLLTCTYHDGSSTQSSHNLDHGTVSETTFLGHRGMREIRDHSPSNSSNKMPSLINGCRRTKRPGSFPESKETHQDSKKSRSRFSCPPLKVKTQKLGDRIQALQKLVAPFGKTDTASVLTEAIGYIQFLHDRVQKLSMPYMKSSYVEHCGIMKAASSKEDRDEESKKDLRRGGLCLVPLSYASYFSSYNDDIYQDN